MHYKNGRPVEIGDFVVGTSHNSGGRIVFGVVIEQMPLQGPCNIKLSLIETCSRKLAEKKEVSYVPLRDNLDRVLVTANFDDFGDAANFIKCEDGLRLAKAAQYGAWNCSYFV
jgi:hypothetical protein